MNDFVGPRQEVERLWTKIEEHLEVDPPTAVDRILGRKHVYDHSEGKITARFWSQIGTTRLARPDLMKPINDLKESDMLELGRQQEIAQAYVLLVYDSTSLVEELDR